MSRLFNIHTQWGEGTASVDEWVDYAQTHNVSELVFIDFVPMGKWDEYKTYMEEKKQSIADVDISFGIEVPAKVLKDTPVHLLKEIPIIAVSERCLEKDDDTPRILEELFLGIDLPMLYWIRPGWWYKRYGSTMLGLEYYVEILKNVPEDKVILEVNRKYNVPPPYVPALLDELNYRFVVGVDAMSPDDLPSYEIPLLGFTFADAEE